MTSYDTIWSAFISQTQTDDINLPSTPDKIYDYIHTAVLHLNNRLRDELTCDDLSETVSRDLSSDEILILAHLLRFNFLKNQLTHFTTLWQPFQKEIGLKNYSFQVNALKDLVKDEERQIDYLVTNTWDGWE